MGYEYAADFFDFVDRSSGRSAAKFLERIALGFEPASVLDVGCGRGVWLAAWKRRGVSRVVGVDGGYVDRAKLHIAQSEFLTADLTQPLDLLGARFDLVQCLEVAEHLPEGRADTLVENVIRHGDIVLFSAATPGQGGEHHVNEQPVAYWAGRFRALGYSAYDCLRPAVRGVHEVEPWYRYNALLYANDRGAARLSEAARAMLVPAGREPAEIAPAGWRLRCALFRPLPRGAVHRLARLKHWFVR